jgi:isopenicillin N synthase-like dioxygenase
MMTIKNVFKCKILLHLLSLSESNRVNMVSADNLVVPVIDLGPWLSASPQDSSKLSPFINQHNSGQSQDTVPLKEEQQDIVNQIHQACSHVGFFMIKNHGFDKSITDNTWKASKEFFSLFTEEKMMHKTNNEAGYPYGYEQSENLAKGKQIDSDKDQRIHIRDLDHDSYSNNSTMPLQDLKETFAIGPNNPHSGMPPRRWIQSPNVPPNFQEAVESYYRHMEVLSLTLLEIFALALDQDISFFKTKMDHHVSALRLAHYFPLEDPKEDFHLVRAGAHTDYGALTILAVQDSGLEVLLEGEWVPVPQDNEALIVNLGDLMQRWTNDKWISTMHRVAMPSTDALEERYSMAFFVNVNGDTVIEPLPSCLDGDHENSHKYPPILAGEHLMAKHLASMGETINRAASRSASEEL